MLKYATQVSGDLRVSLLKPCRRLRRLPSGLHQIVNVFAKGGIGQQAF